MIITIDEVVAEGEVTFNRKRNYCMFCVEHTSSIPELRTLQEELTRLLLNQPVDNVDVHGVRDYEENMEWDSMDLYLPNGTEIEIGEGYTGLWELMHYSNLHDDAKRSAINSLLNWLLTEKIEWHIEYLEHELRNVS